ncbi:MAG: LysM peptidoglycan-binding domain-containing protein [Nitrospirae bacterium]|nr:LysM peptidoglycan-binding domain-containing protein [Nitrospirota bacterium]MBI5696336.1 LysM peptidoglycan-binding domain-containing protein [Nitrospirota bacterium]
MLGYRFFAGLVLGLFVFAAPAALMAEELAVPGKDGGYTVKKGDTLWGLSGEYLDAPVNWPDLWKANPQLKDPDLIYPGETLNIPGRAAGEPAAPPPGEGQGVRDASAGDGGASTGMKKDEPFVEMGKTIFRLPEKPEGQVIVIDGGPKERQPLASVTSILTAGFVAGNDIKTMAIAGSPQIDRHMFTLTEEVYIADDGSLKPGDRLMTFRPGAVVFEPGSGRSLGHIMIVSGLLDVKSRKGDYALAEVSSAFTDVRISDRVVPYADPQLIYEPAPSNPGLRGKWGYVAALKDNRGMNPQEGIIYLGIGSKEGVRSGDSFEVRRSGGRSTTDDGYYDSRKYVLPDVKVGDAVVLSVQPDTSTAVLVYASEPVRPGYRVYYEK